MNQVQNFVLTYDIIGDHNIAFMIKNKKYLYTELDFLKEGGAVMRK